MRRHLYGYRSKLDAFAQRASISWAPVTGVVTETKRVRSTPPGPPTTLKPRDHESRGRYRSRNWRRLLMAEDGVCSQTLGAGS